MKVSLILIALISCALFISISGKPPILIVPGLMGSQLEAKIHDQSQDNCNTGDQYRLLWVGRLTLACMKYLKLKFDRSNYLFKDADGVEVRVRGLGGTESVECSAPSVCLSSSSSSGLGHYLKTFVDFFVGKGYRKGEDLRAAPYDWRLSPKELSFRGYYHSVRKIIESMYKKYGKVTIVAHSYGGPVMLQFLANAMKRWKIDISKYVKAFIPLGAPFGGATMIVGALAFGELPVDIHSSFKGFLIEFLGLKDIIRAFASMYYLAPQPKVFGGQVLLETSNGNYTADNYQRLFERGLKFSMGWNMYNGGKPVVRRPPVPTYCMYGVDVRTPVKYEFKHGKQRTVFGDGDSTVDKISLNVCDKWAKEVHKFPSVGHLSIVSHQDALEAIDRIVNPK